MNHSIENISIPSPALSEPRLSQALAALTIAGSDSGGGAGIQADLRVFAAHGLLGCSAITAITAQNTLGVRAWEPVSQALVSAQITAVVDDLPLRAVKSGMLGTAATIQAVALSLPKNLPYVLDPVMVATSGDRLLEKEAEEALIELLLPMASVLTPNIPEAAVISQLPLDSPPLAFMEAIQKQAPKAWVIIKGGHDKGQHEFIYDYVGSPDGAIYRLEAKRINTPSTHGTGCSYSAAITSQLALGKAPLEAIIAAKSYLAGALSHALPLGAGHGPVDHLFALKQI